MYYLFTTYFLLLRASVLFCSEKFLFEITGYLVTGHLGAKGEKHEQ